MFYSITNRIEYPQELKVSIDLEHSFPIFSKQLFEKIVREKFMFWAKYHKEFISESPLMQRIISIINLYEINQSDPNLNEVKIEARLRECLQTHTISLLRFCCQIESGAFDFNNINVIRENIGMIFQYLDIGIINPDLVVKIFVKQPSLFESSLFFRDEKGNVLIHHPQIFSRIAFHLLQMEPEQIESILCSQDSEGNTLLHIPENFDLGIELVKKLDVHDVPKLFAIINKKGLGPLHISENFSQAYPLFEFLLSEDPLVLFEILAILNEWGLSAVHDNENFLTALPLLEKLGPRQKIRLFSIKTQTGSLLLEDYNCFSTSLSFLKKQSPSTIINILSLQNSNGMPLVLSQQTYSNILPIFQPFSIQELLELISIQNANGYYHFHLQEMVEFTVALFENREHSEVLEFLRNPDNIDFLKDKHVFSWALKVFAKWWPDYMDELLHIKDDRGLPFISNFKTFLPSCFALEAEGLAAALSVQDKFGNPLIFSHDIFMESLRHLKAMSRDKFERIIRITNSKGDTLLHLKNCQVLLSSLIHEYDIDLASFVNLEGVTAKDVAKYELSESWLTVEKDKISPFDEIGKSDDEGEAIQDYGRKGRSKKKKPRNTQSIVDFSARYALHMHIHQILEGKENLDEYAVKHFYYAAGFMKPPNMFSKLMVELFPDAPDTLSLDIQKCTKELCQKWNLVDFIREFGKSLSDKRAFLWLMLTTPRDYNPSMLGWEKYFRSEERSLFKKTLDSLEQIVDRLYAEEIASELRNINDPHLSTTDLNSSASSNMLSKTFLDDFNELMDRYEIPTDQQLPILLIKQSDDRKIRALAEQFDSLGIPYAPLGLFADACQLARRYEYNKKFSGSRTKMLIEILIRSGIIK